MTRYGIKISNKEISAIAMPNFWLAATVNTEIFMP